MAMYDRQWFLDVRSVLDKASVLKVEPKQNVDVVKSAAPVDWSGMTALATNPRPSVELSLAKVVEMFARAKEMDDLAAPWQTGSDGYSIGD